MTSNRNTRPGVRFYQGALTTSAEGLHREVRGESGEVSAPCGSTEPMALEGAAGVEYTCPMHPEVRQTGPGSCPKCGMALEPATVTAANVAM